MNNFRELLSFLLVGLEVVLSAVATLYMDSHIICVVDQHVDTAPAP